jgi:hypothetical protein
MLAAFFSEENGMRILIKDNNRPIAVLYWDSAVIRKYNHHHDKLGRFASSDGSSGEGILGSLGRHKAGDKVTITDQAIKKVPEKASKYLSDDENKALHDMNVAVLTESMKHNNSDEVSQVYFGNDRDGQNTYSDLIHGDKYSVNVEADTAIFHALWNNPERSLIVTHNHPGGSSFSEDDLALFMRYDSIKCISIVTNRGKSFSLTKTKNTGDCSDFYSYAKKLDKRYNEKQRVDLLISELYNYGIRYER